MVVFWLSGFASQRNAQPTSGMRTSINSSPGSEEVLHLNGRRRYYRSLDELRLFEFAESCCQHSVRKAVDILADLREPHGAPGEAHQDCGVPFTAGEFGRALEHPKTGSPPGRRTLPDPGFEGTTPRTSIKPSPTPSTTALSTTSSATASSAKNSPHLTPDVSNRRKTPPIACRRPCWCCGDEPMNCRRSPRR
jgi:hypothetical protein